MDQYQFRETNKSIPKNVAVFKVARLPDWFDGFEDLQQIQIGDLCHSVTGPQQYYQVYHIRLGKRFGGLYEALDFQYYTTEDDAKALRS
jgi:hypothetical protein